ncbi:MAG: polysaccharide biosynthesis/export family protein [Planctomycetota bacterium]
MASEKKFRPQISVATLLLLMAAFSVGFVLRNLVDGIHPFYVGLSVPTSTSPVRAGEVIRIQSWTDDSINCETIVLADSTINLPLVGIVDIQDKTTTQIETVLNKEYAKFLRAPQIQVFRAATSRSQ